jgi:hypothetical protein
VWWTKCLATSYKWTLAPLRTSATVHFDTTNCLSIFAFKWRYMIFVNNLNQQNHNYLHIAKLTAYTVFIVKITIIYTLQNWLLTQYSFTVYFELVICPELKFYWTIASFLYIVIVSVSPSDLPSVCPSFHPTFLSGAYL